MSTGRHVDVRDLFDGKMHEIFPEDWKPIERKIVEWVPMIGVSTLGIESPDLNWVVKELDRSEALRSGVEGGWSLVAIRLQKMSIALGGKPVCYQKGSRYFFQHKLVTEEEL